MIICYKGEDLEVLDTCGNYSNIAVVLFKGQKRVYSRLTDSIVGGDEKLLEVKANRTLRGSVTVLGGW
ncbi:TPA: hypothetical protein IUU06_002078 [Enterococcus faecalis]|uniref:hypothetical protein n=1 Tax=Enterococcus faecalis TaxID=1351 RepID=UPI000668DB69|nr:hypothetical protein [Enterococcus faecalis]HAP3876017.1 hypothetical protein [Enterococcus faecalis]HAP3957114.1 hypothetical protein [Enterococcus faecalis]HAP3978664.1 hypothetical protein [Enterococcus faecalis]HAP4056928.1 hypothetical protein [Enterococcus faecalis]HAP4090731.1 hypothetical protein [Enterococcus faecalis]